MTKVNETVNTKELARTLAERTELLNKGQSEEVVNALADVIFETLVSGKNVKLNGIGVLEARQVEAGTAQNPALYTKLIEQGMSKDDAKAQAQVDVVPHIKPGFSASSTLKKAMKGQA